MRSTKDAVATSGLTVLFEPDNPANAVVDIVFISGPGGHPVKTWQHAPKPAPAPPKSTSTTSGIPTRKGSFRDLLRKNSLKRCISSTHLRGGDTKQPATSGTGSKKGMTAPADKLPTPRQRRVLRKNYPSTSRSESKLLLATTTKEEPGPRRTKSTSRLRLRENEDDEAKETVESVYWPLDFLPSSCPNTRIATWGCQILSTKGRLLPAQNNIFDHAGDLLRDLAVLRQDTRTIGRALVLVTHGLGGIVLKEVLHRSEISCEWTVKDIVQSLAGVVFLGSPHRDCQDGTLRDAVKHLAGLALGMDSNDEVLQDLCGVNRTELESGRQSFVRLWNDYNFRVKTFQEAPENPRTTSHSEQRRADTYQTLRVESACFGDPRERCEPIAAGHLDLGRFMSINDPAYRLLSFTLLRLVHDEINRLRDLTPKEKVILSALKSRPEHTPQERSRIESFPGTGVWLYDLPEFRAWHQRSSGGRNRILWIKGRPGSGKSVLLKSLRGRLERQWGPLNSNLVWSLAEGETLHSVFFPGKCSQHRTASPADVYRSLLSQLYFQDPRLRKALASVCRRSTASSMSTVSIEDSQVVTFFVDDYVDQKIETPTRRTFIFVDATDDCGIPYLEDLLYYLSQLAANSDYSICVATTAHPEIVLDNAIEVVMHQRNVDDILRYINLNLMAEWEDRSSTVVRIGHKADGCFLWAEIVVSILNAAIEEGATEDLVEEAVAEMPGDIDGLYEWLFSTLGPEEKLETLTLMQWVIFSPEPLRLDDLHTAIQLSQKWHPLSGHPYTALYVGPPTSVRDLLRPVSNGGTFNSPSQFYSWVRSRSIGLLALQPVQNRLDGDDDEAQGQRRIRFIHESVRNFFLSGRGFLCLSPGLPRNNTYTIEDFADNAHYSMLRACLSYLNVTELTELIECQALGQVGGKDKYPLLQYAVDNLAFHLLSPRLFRYYLPQRDVLRAFSANKCHLWHRWTTLLGCSAADPDAVMAKCAGSSAKDLLDPVFGTRYRLERIFRTLSKLSQPVQLVQTTKEAKPIPAKQVAASVHSKQAAKTKQSKSSTQPKQTTLKSANVISAPIEATIHPPPSSPAAPVAPAAPAAPRPARAHVSRLPRLKTRPPVSKCFSHQTRSPSSAISPATFAETVFTPLSTASPNTPGTMFSPASIKSESAMRSPIYV